MINLQIDTEVYVKTNKSDDWKRRYFLQWGDNDNILCHSSTTTDASRTPKQWASYPYWRVAEGKYKGFNSQEKSLTKGRSNLALFCLIFGSSAVVMDTIAKYLSYIPRYDFLLIILGVASWTIFALIMIFGKK